MVLTLLHSEWPNLYGVIAVLSAVGLRLIHHFIFFRDPNQPVSLVKFGSFQWPSYNLDTQSYLEITPQMTAQSVQQRFEARKVEFWSKYLPSILSENNK